MKPTLLPTLAPGALEGERSGAPERVAHSPEWWYGAPLHAAALREVARSLQVGAPRNRSLIRQSVLFEAVSGLRCRRAQKAACMRSVP